MSPLEAVEMKQINAILQQTNLIDLVRKANQIIQAQATKEREIQ